MNREDGSELEFESYNFQNLLAQPLEILLDSRSQKIRPLVAVANMCNELLAKLGEAKPTSPACQGWFADCRTAEHTVKQRRKFFTLSSHNRVT